MKRSLYFFGLIAIMVMPLRVDADPAKSTKSAFSIRLVAEDTTPNTSSANFEELPYRSGDVSKILLVSNQSELDGSAITGAEVKVPPSLTDDQIKAKIKSNPLLTEKLIRDNEKLIGGPQLIIKFTEEGAKRFSKFTFNNVKHRMAFVLDKNVIAAPFINEGIPSTSKNMTFSGLGTEAEVNQIATRLQSIIDSN